MRRGILGSPSREWLGCGWACGSTSWKWRLDLITTCLGRAGQHRREKDDQEGAKKKKKLQVLQGLRVSLRRWREGRTSKKCKTTKLMGPLVRVGPSLWPWKEERKLETKGKMLSFHVNVRRNSLLRVCGWLWPDINLCRLNVSGSKRKSQHSSVMLIVKRIYWGREMRHRKTCWQSFR